MLGWGSVVESHEESEYYRFLCVQIQAGRRMAGKPEVREGLKGWREECPRLWGSRSAVGFTRDRLVLGRLPPQTRPRG